MNTVNTFLRSQASAVSSGQGAAPGSTARANVAETRSAPRVQAASVTRSAPPQVDLSKAVEQIQSYLRESGRDLSVSFDDSVDRYVARVVDSSSGEVVRTIPAEEVLDVARMIEEHLGGLVHQKA